MKGDKLFICRLEQMDMNSHWRFYGTTISHFEIILIEQGSGIIIIDSSLYSASGRMLVVTTPGCERKLNFCDGIKGYYLSFSIDFLDAPLNEPGFSILQPYCLTKSFSLVSYANNELQRDILGLLEKIDKEYNSYLQMHQPVIRGLLQLIVLYLSRECNEANYYYPNTRPIELSQKFMVLLKEKHISMKAVSDYAKLLCVSPNYLNQVLKKVSGYTASNLIQNYLIQQAKWQANRSSATLKEIAFNLGFNNPAHFSKFFKSKSGRNFTHFKKQHEVPGNNIRPEFKGTQDNILSNFEM